MTHRDRTLPVIKTLRCQTLQQHTTLHHQDARLEEYAANGASVHSLPQVNASVLPAVCVGHDSVMVKHVSNSGAKRETNQHNVHAHGVNGGLGHDHELHPKLAGEQDAVDAVTRQRDTITRTAADYRSTSALSLRIRIKPQQLHPLVMIRTCLDVRKHSAWMKRS